MSVHEQPPALPVIVVADRMDQVHSWARERGLAYGSTVFVKADGNERSCTVLGGLRNLPYVELVRPNGFVVSQLIFGGHYRLGGT